MRRTEPLFRLDPGWLYTLAGLAVIVASVLLPVERDLHEMRQQLSAIEAREAWNGRRLEAYDRFLKELAAKDPALLKRLAASQLNLMPQGEQPLLMATSIEHTVSDWIEATVPPPDFEPTPPPDTLLSRLSEGPRRLWLIGGGAMMVFVGLIAGIGVSPRPTLPEATPVAHVADEPAPDAADASTDDSPAAALPAVEGGPPEVAATFVDEPAGSAGPAGEELADESHELDEARSTGAAVEERAWEWAEPEPPFEAAEADSVATPDAGEHADGATGGLAGPEADEHAWMREHGSD